jgi:hypothetical protein
LDKPHQKRSYTLALVWAHYKNKSHEKTKTKLGPKKKKKKLEKPKD